MNNLCPSFCSSHALISFFSLPLLLLGLSDTKGAIENSSSSTFTLSSAAVVGNGGTNLVIVVDDGRGIKEFLRGGTDLIGTRCVVVQMEGLLVRFGNVKDSGKYGLLFSFSVQSSRLTKSLAGGRGAAVVGGDGLDSPTQQMWILAGFDVVASFVVLLSLCQHVGVLVFFLPKVVILVL
ncbi:hypothetical protein Tco_0789072 [Tanacetum coccineum]